MASQYPERQLIKFRKTLLNGLTDINKGVSSIIKIINTFNEISQEDLITVFGEEKTNIISNAIKSIEQKLRDIKEDRSDITTSMGDLINLDGELDNYDTEEGDNLSWISD